MKTTKTPGKELAELAPGLILNMGKINPCGSLEARKGSNGAVQFYWRYMVANKRYRETIGFYDSLAAPRSVEPTVKGYSIVAATAAAENLARRHMANIDIGGLPGLVLAAEDEKKRVAAEAVAAEATARDAEKFSLKNLLIQYCDYLVTLGRDTKGDARSVLTIHVINAWPKIAGAPANLLTDDQFADMMRKLFEVGKGRTANKLRSYARAAFQTAKAARSSPKIPLHFKGYAVRHNPVADTMPDETANKTDKNPLSYEEIQAYWKAIKNDPGSKSAVLRLHLLCGSQRIAQLMRLKTADITPDAIKIYDGKGRPGKAARVHIVPLTKHAAQALADCKPKGEFALSTDGGKTHIDEITMSRWAKEFGAGIEGFQTKRLRSGVETLLSSKAKISPHTRGRLQSHGIGGVQNASYDAYDYQDEKLDALEKLYNLLESTSNVVPLKAVA